MRKSLIAQSCAAVIAGLGMAGAAHAIVTPEGATATQLVVNNDGVGHINIVPYFSVQGAGISTNVNIVNTDTTNGKAVKVRFRGAGNSDDVFDFTVLMSPGDVFAFAVSRTGPTAAPKITTLDTTCTLPNNISGRSFVLDRLDRDLTTAQQVEQASEGYVEILTMADIPPTIGSPAAANPLYTTIKHANSKPVNCGTSSPAIRALLEDVADQAGAAAKGMTPPSTGLFTNWTVINVPAASTWSGAAAAVEARDSDGAPALGNVVFFPQTATAINDDNGYENGPADYTTDPVLVGGVDKDGDLVDATVAAASYDFPDLSTPYLAGEAAPVDQARNLSASLSVATIANEYVTDPGIGARTDWVFSSPTRRYSAAVAYGTGTVADFVVFTPDLGFYTASNTTFIDGQICVKNILPTVIADREENFAEDDDDFVISPGTPTEPKSLCGEVSVLTFNGQGSVLGAKVAVFDLDTLGLVDGWAKLRTPACSAEEAGCGLPVIGYAAMEVVNGNVGGAVANYGLTFPHRVTRPVDAPR